MSPVIVFLFLLLQSDGLLCLRDVVLEAPRAVKAGTTLHLICHYDLEGVPLYSIKFYQGDQEFYRFVPKESPPTRVFPLPEIEVDIYESNNTVVTLNDVRKELTGLYKCEVSADAPFFHTLIRTSDLIVVEEPKGLPEIHVDKLKYTLGERIEANCSSASSFPAANLSFQINNIQLGNNDLTSLSWFVKTEYGGLETSILRLKTIAVPMLFPEGRMDLECLATQFDLYRRSVSVLLYEEMPQLAQVVLKKDTSKATKQHLCPILFTAFLFTFIR